MIQLHHAAADMSSQPRTRIHGTCSRYPTTVLTATHSSPLSWQLDHHSFICQLGSRLLHVLPSKVTFVALLTSTTDERYTKPDSRVQID
jgi:hypothetical protein